VGGAKEIQRATPCYPLLIVCSQFFSEFNIKKKDKEEMKEIYK